MVTTADPLVPLAAALGLALVHSFSPVLDRLPADPERVLSAAAGTAVAYVFVEAFPAIAGLAGRLAVPPPTGWSLVEQVHVVALAGFVLYFWLEGYIRDPDAQGGHPTGPRAFAVHLGSFALYNLLVGYLLVYPHVLGHGLALFALVMGLHVLGTDYDLILHHGDRFRRIGRWILVGSVLVGTAVGAAVELAPVVPGLAYAFLAGGIVLNVVKGELPGADEASYPAFLAGTVVATAVMTLL